jgi:hypothetical protein
MPSPYGQFYNFASGSKRMNPGKNFDKYVETKGKKNRKTYELRDGYESLNLGAGSRDRLVATYTNDYDDMHDDFDASRDVKQYGIYRTAKSAPAAAPAPAPAPAPKAAAPAPVANPYKDQADALLKTIQAMAPKPAAAAPPPKPTTIFAASQAVQPSNLTIASAGEASKQTGTSSFKRRKKTNATSNLRTIQSVNV